MRKVTMQSIADALGVSRVTVWKVFNNQAGVSESLKMAVINKAEELGYNKNISEQLSAPETYNISLVVARPESSIFWTGIIHSMAEELSKNSANLLYTSIEPIYSDNFSLPGNLKNGSLDLAVVMNVYDEQILRKINNLSMPKIFLDNVPALTFADMNGDLLLIEGYHSTYNITESVVKKGIREIGFIGDIHYARTNMDRYKGFCECLKVYDIEKQDKFCLTTPFDIYSYKQIIFDFLDSLNPLPEAFVCVSDYIAHFIQFYFSEHPDRIPEGIIITGFDASDEYTNVDGQITTAEVKTDHLGKRLASQALYRIANPDAPYELTYVRPDIVYRESRILI